MVLTLPFFLEMKPIMNSGTLYHRVEVLCINKLDFSKAKNKNIASDPLIQTENQINRQYMPFPLRTHDCMHKNNETLLTETTVS